MTRENVKMNMDIISAFAEGKTIQYKTVTGVWCDLTEREGLPMGTLEEEPNNFRIKPKSEYRPFKDAEECWAEMLKHEPFVWEKDKETHKFLVCKALRNILFFIGIEDKPYNYNEVLRDYTFADGTPFGIKVEE